MNEIESQRLPKSDPGSARARVAELREILDRAKADFDQRERHQLERGAELEATLAAERHERAALEEERADAANRIEYLEHTLAQAIRRLALIDEKLAIAEAPADPDRDGDAQAPSGS